MKRRTVFVLLVAGGPLGCVTGVARTSPLGRPVQVQTSGERKPSAGELVALDEDQLLLRDAQGPRRLAMAEVEKVRVQRTGLTSKTGYQWTLMGALLTGAGLAASCTSVSGNSCARVGAVTAGAWLVFGGLAAVTMDRSSYTTLRKPTVEQLKPYARFPQGLPPGFDLRLPTEARPGEPRKTPASSKPK
jgi:hypothetical protein